MEIDIHHTKQQLLLKKIQHDVNPLELYEQELFLGWTESAPLDFIEEILKIELKNNTKIELLQ
ncbi:MAG: hypothetical protein H9897_02245 [Candidatus Ureaplasma intestinipullorum]|uniref:Uncharacterized protein n=1 Tax=Candidatus Ureaplasma intestinipullorum TaxID=2838770 RepID=A0A9E2KXM5_9BACT|nr:hypothetical protein [Candidatus Ureaplasma intestinipullorum]